VNELQAKLTRNCRAGRDGCGRKVKHAVTMKVEVEGKSERMTRDITCASQA
jgi:hypothetical protein